MSKARSDRGVMLILVAVSLFVLMAMGAFVLDHGIMWMSRRQAQNAADAGALAGAAARVFDDPSPTWTPGGFPEQAAQAAATQNRVFGMRPPYGSIVVTDTCPPGASGGGCVEVRVFRDGTNSSTALPTVLAPLFGIASQNVRAIANAQAANANGTNCMRPWMIPDKFLDNNSNGTFDIGTDEYRSPLTYPPDTDGWPPEAGEATGWTILDIGTVLMLNPGSPHDAVAPSNYYQVGPSPTYYDSIVGCALQMTLGEWIDTNPGGAVGPTRSGVTDLTAEGPVVVPIGMFDPAWFAAQDRISGEFDLQLQNMMGLEITGIETGGTINGIVRSTVGEINPGPTVGGGASFVKQVVLVR